jgi:hypothetical protein
MEFFHENEENGRTRGKNSEDTGLSIEEINQLKPTE